MSHTVDNIQGGMEESASIIDQKYGFKKKIGGYGMITNLFSICFQNLLDPVNITGIGAGLTWGQFLAGFEYYGSGYRINNLSRTTIYAPTIKSLSLSFKGYTIDMEKMGYSTKILKEVNFYVGGSLGIHSYPLTMEKTLKFKRPEVFFAAMCRFSFLPKMIQVGLRVVVSPMGRKESWGRNPDRTFEMYRYHEFVKPGFCVMAC